MRGLVAQRDLCVLIALHDINQAVRFADRVLILQEGRLVASGPPSEIVTVDLLRRVYGVEARIERCSRGQIVVLVDRAVTETAELGSGEHEQRRVG
jgi:iron complex transport system ATP-binding protein